MAQVRPGWCIQWGLAVAIALLSGCANVRLYSEVRDKQGTAAKEAWAAVDLSALISTERANLRRLLDAELETQDKLAAGIRNHELRAMVEAPSLKAGLIDSVDRRLTNVAGGADQVRASRNRLAAFRTRETKLDVTADEFKFKGLAVPSCDALDSGQTPPAIEAWRRSAAALDAVDIDAALANLRKLCLQGENDIVASVYRGLGGEIATALVQHDDAAAIQKKAEETAAVRKAEYRTALATYESALAESRSDSAALAKVQTAAAKLNTAVSALAAAADALSIQFLSKERLDALDRFVDAVTEAKGDGTVPAGANKAATAFILLPGLLDEARQSLADAKKPLAMPLLLRRNHEQLRLEGATREVEARRAYVRLSREIVDALYDQAVQLWLADGELRNALVTPLHARRFTEAFRAPGLNDVQSSDAKELLYTAAARYLDTLNRLSARRYRLEYMRIATVHEVSLAYAEVNMKQWQSLIGISVDQVAAAGASGIRAENITALLNTLGVLWIGHGVNK